MLRRKRMAVKQFFISVETSGGLDPGTQTMSTKPQSSNLSVLLHMCCFQYQANS